MLVRWVVWLAPIGVFALVLPLGAHGGAGLVGAIGFYILAYSLASILFVLLLYPVVAIVARVPMRDFARAALPAQLIAFSLELIDRVAAGAGARARKTSSACART